MAAYSESNLSASREEAVTDLLVKGGTVIDGTGASPFAADVRIRGGRIAEVGAGLAPDGERQIDAGGAYVTPGFIDTHTHLDPTLFWDRRCDPLPLHGVTTAVAGNCSLSLAPTRREGQAALIGLFGYVEDLDEDMLASALPWDWETQAELHESLGDGLGINAAFLVGHTPLRLYVMGPAAWDRTANDDEIDEMARILDESIRSGAMGMSTSFFDRDAAGRMVPSAVADDRELERLVDVLAGADRVLEFIPNLRQADYRSDIERVAAICGPRKVRASWNGLFAFEDRPEFAPGLLEHAARLQERGVMIYPQVSPRPLDTRINWAGGMVTSGMRESWERYRCATGAARAAMLADPDWRAACRREWDSGAGGFVGTHFDRVRLASASRPEDERWVGRTLADLVAAEPGHPSDVLADWVQRNGGQPELETLGKGNGSHDAVAAQLLHPASIISNSDAGAHVRTLCSYGDTTGVLTTYVRERADLSLEQAVRELTSRQADIFGLPGRGRIAVGAVGDLAVFALDELHYAQDELVDDLPGQRSRLRRSWGGYRYTIVGGGVVQEGGCYTEQRPGVIVR
jgi:N-acyl-D-aspartate/D-glutamate deacylase